jgi:hypothetical protein
MKNKGLFIGLGVLAVAGIGYYIWKKKSETKPSIDTTKKLLASDTNKEKELTLTQVDASNIKSKMAQFGKRIGTQLQSLKQVSDN